MEKDFYFPRPAVPLTLCPSENNKPPVADAGPEKELTLPVDRTMLDGSKSSDDQKIATYHWKQTKWVRHRCMHTSGSLHWLQALKHSPLKTSLQIQLNSNVQKKLIWKANFYSKFSFTFSLSVPVRLFLHQGSWWCEDWECRRCRCHGDRSWGRHVRVHPDGNWWQEAAE